VLCTAQTCAKTIAKCEGSGRRSSDQIAATKCLEWLNDLTNCRSEEEQGTILLGTLPITLGARNEQTSCLGSDTVQSWPESKLCNNRTKSCGARGQGSRLYSHVSRHDSSEPFTNRRNNGVKMGEHGRL